MFTYDGEFDQINLQIHPGAKTELTTDRFENITENYRLYDRHQIPGGLKVCLTTEYGRQQHGG